MRHPLPKFPPLFPTGEWWRLRLKALLAGFTPEESIREANRTSLLKARDWMRFYVLDDRDEEVLLSVPVVHGASALKNTHPSTWRVDDDKPRCRKVDATLSTLYGKTPYFAFIYPLLNVSQFVGIKASEACLVADKAIVEILGLDNPSLIESIKKTLATDKTFSLPELPYPDIKTLSVLDSLFKFGPQTIFALIHSF